MKKKILIRVLFGFVTGLVFMFVIPALINHVPIGSTPMYSDTLLARVGSPVAARLLTLLVIGLFGVVCFCCTLLYEVESWSLVKATVVHYLTMSLGYLIPAWLLCWEMPLKLLLIIEACMTVSFFLIWLILYLHYKAETRKLNELLRERELRESADAGKTEEDTP